MLLIQCPNCHHDNIPGEQFCAKCGVPLNLRPCPQCGKVHPLTETVCSGCGAAFPSIAPEQIHHDGKAAKPWRRTAPSPAGDGSAAHRQTTGAVPLIVIALAAGGIPLLWMNRAYIPLPKAWQIAGPNATGSAVAPSVPAVMAPAPAPAVASAPVPQEPPAKQETAVVPEPPHVATPTPKPAAGMTHGVARAHNASQPPEPDDRVTATSEPTRPCTEALTALGLCNPAATRK
jgi:hypothetical protein